MPSNRPDIIINLALPLLIIALAIPLVCEKIPPNGWYGFRIQKTFSSDEMWYRTNKLGGQYFIVAALLQMAAAVILGFIWPRSATPAAVWAILPGAPVLIAALLWYLRIRKF